MALVTHPCPLPFTAFVLRPMQRKSHRTLHTCFMLHASCVAAKMQFTTASTKFGVVAALLMALAVNGAVATQSTSTEADRKYSPSSKLHTRSLRRLQTSNGTEPIVGSTPEECGCTDSSANTGGLGFLELLYTGPTDYIDTIMKSMTVFDNRKGGALLYDADADDASLSVAGSWRTDSAGLNYFRFEYPAEGKKVTQTAFHFCLDADEGPCETTPVEKGGTQSVCGPSLIFGDEFSDNFCYYWDVHTSCSTYLIGEAILFDVPDFEIVAWGDRNAEPQRICECIICIMLH